MLLFIVFVLFAGGWLKNKCLWVVIAQSLGHFRVLFYISTGLQHSKRIPCVHSLSLRHTCTFFVQIQTGTKDPGRGKGAHSPQEEIASLLPPILVVYWNPRKATKC